MRVQRCFGFLDLCGFTAFTEREGDERTVLVLAELRAGLREASARRGVRVVKWLGDGAMLSSTDVDAVVGVALETRARLRAGSSGLQLRIGIDRGPVIMFEGDDYIGRSVNMASRLCDRAKEGKVMATVDVVPQLPPWVAPRAVRAARIQGFANRVEIVELDVAAVPAGEAVTDPVCGLTIPAAASIAGPDGERYCSAACAGIEAGAVVG